WLFNWLSSGALEHATPTARMPANRITRRLPALNFMNAPEQWKMTMFSLDAGERWWSGKIGTRIWRDTWSSGAKARIGAARSGTAEAVPFPKPVLIGVFPEAVKARPMPP